jgi:transcriptional regulator with XRE-family HTH domain
MTSTINSPQQVAEASEMSLQEIVTRNIKVAMVLRNINQKELAKALGYTPSAISQKVTGRVDWNLVDIEKASGFLNVKPEALVAGHGFEPWTSGFLDGPRGPRFTSMTTLKPNVILAA